MRVQKNLGKIILSILAVFLPVANTSALPPMALSQKNGSTDGGYDVIINGDNFLQADTNYVGLTDRTFLTPDGKIYKVDRQSNKNVLVSDPIDCLKNETITHYFSGNGGRVVYCCDCVG